MTSVTRSNERSSARSGIDIDTSMEEACSSSQRFESQVTPELPLMDPDAAKQTPTTTTAAERGAAELLPHSPRKSKTKIAPSKKLKLTKTKTKKKEVIDYSSKQGDKDKCSSGGTSPLVLTASDDPLGKVQNWLLNSQKQPTVALPAEASAADVPAVQIPKSKSSPAGLTSPHRSPHKSRLSDSKDKYGRGARSAAQPATRPGVDKVRLQVLYKGPFKFRLKLNGGVTTKLTADRVRKVSSKEDLSDVRKKVVGSVAGPRTAVLVRTKESNDKKSRSKREAEAGEKVSSVTPGAEALPPASADIRDGGRDVDIDSNIHTVPSDLEGLLSETEEKEVAA